MYMDNALPMLRLPNIRTLFSQKDQELSQELGDLQINDVREDIAFQATTKRIKNQVLLAPISFGEPIIKGHRSEQKTYPQSYQHMLGHAKDVLVVTVDFPFTGSSELFSFSPDNLSFSSSDTRVHQPDYGNTISIEVEVQQLDKLTVLSMAEAKMKTTFSLINQINPQAQQWSATKEPMIDAALQKKRAELVSFYS